MFDHGRLQPVTDLLFFTGTWTLTRTVVDDAGRQMGHFTGTASFTPVAGGLRYVESGTLATPQHTGPASRRLHWAVDGPTARVTFADGRHFHDLDLRSGRCDVQHPCGDDHYAGRYEVVRPGRWTQWWAVRGPVKAYDLHSAFTRAGSRAGPGGQGGQGAQGRHGGQAAQASPESAAEAS